MTEKEAVRFLGFNAEIIMNMRKRLETEKNEKEIEGIKGSIKNLKRESAWIYREYRKSLATN